MAVLTMLRRDVRDRLRDRSAIVLGLLAPAALMTVFSLAAQGPSQNHVPVGFAGQADSPLSQAIHDGALASLAADGTIDLLILPDGEGLRASVENGEISAGIVVDGDGAVEVVHGSDDVVANSITDAVASSAIERFDGVGEAVVAEAMLGVTNPSPEAIVGAITAAESTIEVRDSSETVAGLDINTQMAAGMATFFLFFTVQFGVLGLLAERRAGTLARLLVAPVAPWQVLMAKVLGSFVIGLMSMVSLLLFARLLLDARWGNTVGVAILVVAGVTAAVSTITLVVGIASSPEQAQSIQAMLALVLGLLGGSFFSLARAGALAKFVSQLTPHYWFGEGLLRLSTGGSWTAALGPAAAMMLFALLVGAPGLVLSSRTVRP